MFDDLVDQGNQTPDTNIVENMGKKPQKVYPLKVGGSILVPDDPNINNNVPGKSPAGKLAAKKNGSLLWSIDNGKLHDRNMKMFFQLDECQMYTFKKIRLLDNDKDITVKSDLLKVFPQGLNMRGDIPIMFMMSCQKKNVGNYVRTIHCLLQNGETELTGVIRIVIKVTNEEIESLETKIPYQEPDRNFLPATRNIIPGLKLTFKTGLKEVRNLNIPKKEEDSSGVLESTSSWGNYQKKFIQLLAEEEEKMNQDIRMYDMKDATFSLTKQKTLLSLEVPGLSENRPSLLKGDRIFSRFYTGNKIHPENKEYEGFVHEIHQNQILVGFSPDFIKRYVPNLKFYVRFTFNKTPLRAMKKAIWLLPTDHPFWESLLFPEPGGKPVNPPETFKVKMFDYKIEHNVEQKEAVCNILNGGIPGVPYIIFGPPGTGKTITMVEAIKQVWKNKPRSNLLVCAPSNTATDLLADRLLDHIPPSEILRFYAASMDEKRVPDKLKKISNFAREIVDVSSMLKYRIIVVTLVTSFKMYIVGFPDGHFSHVFIDEAGQASEPETLIPVTGILPKQGGGQLILAGDPMQLGPVLRSPKAIECGLDISLLERLMSRKIYSPGSDGVSYNKLLITKLRNNFRSHPKLIEVPAKLFYQSDLVAMGNPLIINSMENWKHLPEAGFPMIFDGVIGEDRREEKCPSYFNSEEAVKVVNYVQILVEDRQKGMQKVAACDIGIITPYRKQVAKIQELLKKRFQKTFPSWTDITVGSTEIFQGQERKIIIISTVRSQVESLAEDFTFNLGFIKNPKRFNVAITRMKSLLIVVGNPNLLNEDPNWVELILFAAKNDAFIGQVRYDASIRGVEKLVQEQGLPEKIEVLKPSLEPQPPKPPPASEDPMWRGDI